MRSMPWLPCALLGLSIAACGGGGPEGSADPSTGTLTGPASAEIEDGDRVDTRRRDHEGETTVVAAQPGERPLITFVRASAGDAEDGAGNVVHAPQRIAVDLDAHRFPPRAFDPVLTIGDLRFVHYEHPRPGVLRFALVGEAQLPLGAEVSIQYGDDASSRRVLVQSLSAADLEEVTP
jgi:hypothetical protein